MELSIYHNQLKAAFDNADADKTGCLTENQFTEFIDATLNNGGKECSVGMYNSICSYNSVDKSHGLTWEIVWQTVWQDLESTLICSPSSQDDDNKVDAQLQPSPQNKHMRSRKSDSRLPQHNEGRVNKHSYNHDRMTCTRESVSSAKAAMLERNIKNVLNDEREKNRKANERIKQLLIENKNIEQKLNESKIQCHEMKRKFAKICNDNIFYAIKNEQLLENFNYDCNYASMDWIKSKMNEYRIDISQNLNEQLLCCVFGINLIRMGIDTQIQMMQHNGNCNNNDHDNISHEQPDGNDKDSNLLQDEFNTKVHQINEWIDDSKKFQSMDFKLDSFRQEFETSVMLLNNENNKCSISTKDVIKTFEKKLQCQDTLNKLNDKLKQNNVETETNAQSMKRTETTLREILNKIETNLNQLKRESETNVEIKQKHNSLASERTDLEKQINQQTQLNDNYKLLLAKHNQFNTESSQCQTELKARREQGLNKFESNWLNWGYDDIVFWFKIKLGYFDKYYHYYNNNNDNNNNNSSACKIKEFDEDCRDDEKGSGSSIRAKAKHLNFQVFFFKSFVF